MYKILHILKNFAHFEHRLKTIKKTVRPTYLVSISMVNKMASFCFQMAVTCRKHPLFNFILFRKQFKQTVLLFMYILFLLGLVEKDCESVFIGA